MPMSDPEALVSTEWLAAHLDAPDIRVIDGSWYLPGAKRDARQDYEDAHIPGAIFLDIEELSDKNSPYPHMLPPSEMFSSRMRKLGLGDGLRLIVYDGAGIYSAPRVWWMFRAMGHRDVAVLDGGLPKWRREGRPLNSEPPRLRERHATIRMDRTLIRDVDQIAANLQSKAEQILDARSQGRFLGREAEPRPNLRGGHVPAALNLPFDRLVKSDGTMRDRAALRAAFETAGIALDKPIVTMCGSGVTAAILSLGLAVIGHQRNSLYDGSWAEWGSRQDLPVQNSNG